MEALKLLAVRMDACDAARVADRLVELLENTEEIDDVRGLDDGVAALVSRISAKDAARWADMMAEALDKPHMMVEASDERQQTGYLCVWRLEAATAALVSRMDVKDSARWADRLAKALDSPQKTGSLCLARRGRPCSRRDLVPSTASITVNTAPRWQAAWWRSNGFLGGFALVLNTVPR
jgi:hypothetical protein